jgi:nucleoporin NUP82
MESWIRKLENELCEPQIEGADFRSKLLFEGARTLVENPLPFPPMWRGPEPRSATIVVEDGNIGYLLLGIVGDRPISAQLDAPDDGYLLENGDLSRSVVTAGVDSTQPDGPRQPYQPAKELYNRSKLAAVIEEQVPQRRRGTLKEEVRLSPANLELLMHVHRVLSQETHQLGLAVADLFRRCERMRDELKEQIWRAGELKVKIDGVTGDDEVLSEHDSGSDVAVGTAKIENRIEGVRERQEKLTAQYDRIRRKLASVGPPELSEKEALWVDEIAVMDRALLRPQPTPKDDDEIPTSQRLNEVKRLKQELKKQAEEALEAARLEQRSAPVKVPSVSRKLENEQVERLLERETALVEAATQRLQSLGISIPTEARP